MLLLSPGFVFAQSESDRTKPPAPEFFLTTIPVRTVLRDINVGFAHRIDFFHTIEVRLGWVHPNKVLHNVYEGWFTSTEMHYQGPSVYFQLCKWSFGKTGKYKYLGANLGYRYLWYYDKGMWMGGMGGSSFAESITLSQWRNDIFLLGSYGLGTTKLTCAEISIGLHITYTHTNVSDTRFHFPDLTAEEYEDYKRSTADGILFSEGWGIFPVIRFTSRLGWFSW